MKFHTFFAAAMAVTLALPAFGQETKSVAISDAFALASPGAARSGAAFMVISNAGTQDDRLVEARSDIAARVELHTHLMDSSGVARMVEVEDGFPVPAGGSHALQRGADHVMFMGLHQPLEAGQTVHVTLVFEQAGEVEVEIPVVEAARQGPAMGGAGGGTGHGPMQMQGHKHGG